MAKYTLDQLARMIDHTNLKADALETDLLKLCEEAKKYHFAMVAINQVQSATCAKFLKGTDIKIGAAIAFPFGQTSIEAKVFETENALQNGANEIDYVIHIGKARAQDWDYLKREMEAVTAVCRKHNVICKVIFENCYLTNDEKIKLCSIASVVKPDFIKTSTGLAAVGATIDDVSLMRAHVATDIRVKASGGIRDANTFLQMLKNGANRVGSSSGITIIEDIKKRFFANGEEHLQL